MELAEALQRRALEQAAADVVGEGAAAADQALAVTIGAIERVHRTLRRIIALETHIAEGALARQLKAQIERAERAQARRRRIGERKRAVHDAVTLVAHMEDRSWAIEEMNTRPSGSPYAAFRLVPRTPHAPIWPERDIPGLAPLTMADTG